MNDYSPIIYIWLEVPYLPGTRAQFMLSQYLGGNIRSGHLAIRAHIWLSDNDIITFRETLPHTISDIPSVVRAYAEAVQQRILDYVAKVLRDRTDASTREYRQEHMDQLDDILDEANG